MPPEPFMPKLVTQGGGPARRTKDGRLVRERRYDEFGFPAGGGRAKWTARDGSTHNTRKDALAA